MSKFDEIKNSHLALAQYYRWYQVYEVPFTKARIANQANILADDVEIESAAGVTKGKDGLEERLMLFDGWQNAHHVQNTKVQLTDHHELQLEADILYQNIRPDNTRYSYTIHYSTLLELRENELPVFKNLKLVPTGSIENPEFKSAYADNRAKSFMHYWLYLMETADVNGSKFNELLAQDFELDLSTAGKIDTLESFGAWLKEIPNRVSESGHTPKNLIVHENQNGSILISVNFEWEGISAEGHAMVAETSHEWLLENNMDERFARMKKMKVIQVKPFQVVKALTESLKR